MGLLHYLTRKLEPWFVLWSFFLLRLLCVSINLAYGISWNTVVMSELVGAGSCYLELLDQLQKQLYKTVGPSIAASLDPLAHRRNVASLYLFCRYYFGRFLFELAQLILLVVLIDCMIFLSPCLDVIRVSTSTVSFLA